MRRRPCRKVFAWSRPGRRRASPGSRTRQSAGETGPTVTGFESFTPILPHMPRLWQAWTAPPMRDDDDAETTGFSRYTQREAAVRTTAPYRYQAPRAWDRSHTRDVSRT